MTRSQSSLPAGPRHGPFAGVPVVAGFTLLSRVLGLARDAATAAVFGAGPALDAFTVAFRLPNLARRLLGEGALSAALLPALVRTRRDAGGGAADALAAAIVVRLAAALGAAALFASVVAGVAAGFVRNPEWRLLCGLTAVCAPLAAFTCVAAQLAAALHARERFAAAAACPILLNLLWLAGVAGAVGLLGGGAPAGTAIYAVAAAVTLAGAVQVAFLVGALRRAGFVWRWDPAGTRAGVAGVRAAVLPVLAGLSVTQVNALLDGFLAWGLAAPAGDPAAELLPGVPYPLRAGAASALYFGQRLYQFPVGVFGAAVGTVLFPRFAAAGGDELKRSAAAGLRVVLYVGLPASVGLVLTADLLTAALLGRGAFDAAAAARTAAAAAALGAGAWAACGLSVAARLYYATGDRRTPVVVGVWAVGGEPAAQRGPRLAVGGGGVGGGGGGGDLRAVSGPAGAVEPGRPRLAGRGPDGGGRAGGAGGGRGGGGLPGGPAAVRAGGVEPPARGRTRRRGARRGRGLPPPDAGAGDAGGLGAGGPRGAGRLERGAPIGPARRTGG